MTTVTQIKLDLTCRLLFAADSLGKIFFLSPPYLFSLFLGFVFIYEVENYAMKHESDPPRCTLYPLVLNDDLFRFFRCSNLACSCG